MHTDYCVTNFNFIDEINQETTPQDEEEAEDEAFQKLERGPNRSQSLIVDSNALWQKYKQHDRKFKMQYKKANTIASSINGCSSGSVIKF